VPFPIVALVGYTYAGKSTLFNRLSRADSFVADQLFATLDPTTRRLHLGEGVNATISDTVGFVRNLPHGLVAAFRSTLEETVQADLLLHVVDASNPRHDEQIDAVNVVLAEIGAADIPQIVIWNKIDRIPGAEPEVVRDPCGKILNIKASAVSGAGLEAIRAALADVARETDPRALAPAA
jgi:GTP-binding protein HflX